MPHFGDDLHLGGGPGSGRLSTGPSPMDRGVGPLGRVYIYDVVPLASGTTLLATAQTLGAAGNLQLTAGTGVTPIVNTNGEAVLQLDTRRRVTLSSTGALSGINFTLTGYDSYGQLFTSVIAGPSNDTVVFPKAAFQVLSIAASGAVGTNITAGFNDAFGLPVRVTDAAYILSVKWDSTLAPNAGTFVAADTTDPATTLTGDVRGVYTPAGNAANGARRLVMAIALPAIACGPNSTRAGAFGVTQV